MNSWSYWIKNFLTVVFALKQKVYLFTWAQKLEKSWVTLLLLYLDKVCVAKQFLIRDLDTLCWRRITFTACLITTFSLLTNDYNQLTKIIGSFLKAKALVIIISIVAYVFARDSTLLFIAKVELARKLIKARHNARVQIWATCKETTWRAAWNFIKNWSILAALCWWVDLGEMAVCSSGVYCIFRERWDGVIALSTSRSLGLKLSLNLRH